MKAQTLWEQHYAVAEACLGHPFIRGIADGTLPQTKFAYYVGQDAYFLRAFARGYALAMARTPDENGLEVFKSLLDGVFAELELHESYARKWGVSTHPEPAPATLAYTDFLLHVAALETPGHTIAAMTPCMRLYAWLGKRLKPKAVPDTPYRDWIDTYSSDDFNALAEQLEVLLDFYGGEAARLAHLYGRAMELERNFFDAAWQG